MHRALLAACVAASLAACERPDRGPVEEAPVLTLSVETPPALHWGGTGTLRVILANEGDVAADGRIVEVHVPDWLEFGTVEPPGTVVMVVSGDSETRLAYQITDSIAPGEQRIITQHLRVRRDAPPPPAPAAGDTVETVRLGPGNQVVRARLLTLDGAAAGAEVRATLHFAGGAAGPDTPLPPGAPGSTTPDTAGIRQDPTAPVAPQRPDTTGGVLQPTS